MTRNRVIDMSPINQLIKKSSNQGSTRIYRRSIYFIAIIMTILLGLASRKFGYTLPRFIANHAGDALWALMVYFGFRFLLVQKNVMTAISLSLLFCFSIEFSQLYQRDWINQIRGTVLGALILGKGFLMVDLIRYSVGILIGAILDLLVKDKKTKKFTN